MVVTRKLLDILVIFQVIIINLVFIPVGSHVLTIESDVFKTFVIAVFVEVVGLPLIVTKSLFPTAKEKTTGKLLETSYLRNLRL